MQVEPVEFSGKMREGFELGLRIGWNGVEADQTDSVRSPAGEGNVGILVEGGEGVRWWEEG